MKLFSVAAAVAVLVGSVAVYATDAKKTTETTKAMTKMDIQTWNLTDIPWKKDPSAPVSIHVMWGDPTKGEYGALVKFDKGASVPKHWHTHDNYAAGLQGTMTITTDTKTFILTPGTVGMLPGKIQHTTSCGADMDCIMFARQPGKDDIHMVATTAKK